jgi:hypothetical protein
MKGLFFYAKLVMQNLFAAADCKDLYKEIYQDIIPKGIEQE